MPIGEVDEGIMFTHTDLVGQIWTNPYDPADGIDNDGNGYIDDIHGWDFDGNNNTIYDGSIDDHGTHVAGGVAIYAATHPGASVATIRSTILSSVVPTASVSGKCATGGRLNVSGF